MQPMPSPSVDSLVAPFLLPFLSTSQRSRYGGTETASFITQVYNSGYLDEILSGRYDEGTVLLWLVDKDGNKKEITKESTEGDGIGCIIGVCNALAFTGVVVVVVCLLLGLLGN